jgi:prepilin peptidase CpaA
VTDAALLHATDAALLGTVALAAWTDWRTKKIPNRLTYPAMALGLLLQVLRGGAGEGVLAPGLESGAAGMLLGLGLFGLMSLTGGLGMGDVKLAGAIGALTGFPAVLGALLFGTIAGGVQALGVLAARSGPGRRFLKRLGVGGTDDPAFGRKIRLGIGLALGTAVFWVWVRLPTAASS